MQFKIIRIMGQFLEMDMISLSATRLIQVIKVLQTFVFLIIMKSTSNMISFLWRDSMVVQKDLKNSRSNSGRCGEWNGLEAEWYESDCSIVLRT